MDFQCSQEVVADKMDHKIEDMPAVHISNLKTLEFQVIVSGYHEKLDLKLSRSLTL